MQLDLHNPDTWASPDARNEIGTLLCICGKPGREFYSDGIEFKDGQEFGLLRGVCCPEHWEIYKRHTRPEEFAEEPELEIEEMETPAPATDFLQVSLFDTET